MTKPKPKARWASDVLFILLMALSAFAGSFNIGLGAATTTVAVTGVGFQPKVVIFWWNGRTESTDAVGRATHHRGFGWATSATNRYATSSRSVDAGASATAHNGITDQSCILEVAAGSTIVGEADLQSMDSDGFTLVIDDQFVTDLRVRYLALAGDSLTNVVAGAFTPTGTAPVTQAITGVGFQPSLVLFMTTVTGTINTADPDSSLCLGVANGTAGEAVWAGGSNTGAATMVANAYAKRGECIATWNTGVSSFPTRAEFTSFDTDGFTINWLERGTAPIVSYLALAGLSSVVGDLLTQTDTVTAITETGFGFQPSAALFVSACRAESTADTPTAHDQLSIGAAVSATSRLAAAVLDEDAVADSEVTTASEFDAVYANIATDSTIQGLMDLTSFDSDGLSAIMDDADPSQAFVWYLALGPAAGGGGGSPVRRSRLTLLGVH